MVKMDGWTLDEEILGSILDGTNLGNYFSKLLLVCYPKHSDHTDANRLDREVVKILLT